MRFLLIILCFASIGWAFRNPAHDNNHNTTAPPGTAGYWWDKIAISASDGTYQIPIGPRLLISPQHVNMYVGKQTTQLGVTATVTNVFTTTNQYDCVYSMLDKPLPVVWQLYMGEPFTETNQYLCIGFGLGKGAPLPDGSGYYYGDPATYRQRWTIPTEKYYTPWLEEIGQSWDPVNQQWIINSNRQCRATAASSVNTDESAWAVAGDSGSPILMNCGKGTNEWVLMGIMASGIGLATDLKYANNAMGAGPGPFVDMEILLYVIQTGELPAESPAWKVPTPVATTAARRFPSWIPEITPFPNHGIPK